MPKLLVLASMAMLAGVVTAAAAASSDTSDKGPVAKNSQFQMLADKVIITESGRSKRAQALDDPGGCPTRTNADGKTQRLCGAQGGKSQHPGGSTGPTKPPKPTQGNVNR
jgi:hypothetical protein